MDILKNFKIRIIVLLVILLLLVAGLSIHFIQFQFTAMTPFILGAIALVIIRLYWVVDKTNREVADFLLNIRYNDWSAAYSENEVHGESYRKLHGAFNAVTEKFRDIRVEKEAQYQYLQAIVEHVDTGLICFDQKGQCVLMNKSLQQLLHKSYFPNLKSVEKFNPGLCEAMEEIKPSEKKLVKLVIQGRILQLAIRKTILNLTDRSLHLFAIHNIHTELERQEVETWQKLIRILTHEIMNSISPVVSLSATTRDLLGGEPLNEDLTDVRQAVDVIHRRSSGLMNFTQTYRKLTKIPPPKFEMVDPVKILNNVITLLQTSLSEKNIQVSTNFPKHSLSIQADPGLLEQVLLNLFKNGVEALEDSLEPFLEVTVLKDTDSLCLIQIRDNGKGMDEDVQSQIFIPFFTTKEEGSGIGLSLCRQIVHMHKGSLTVYSEPGKGSCFTIKI